MEPSRSTPIRPESEILHPVPDHEVQGETSGLALVIPGGDSGMNTVRQDAEGAVHYLMFTTQKPAVLLAKDWHVTGVPYAFEHMALYQAIAAASQCVLVTVSRPEAGGEEHLLFVARIAGLRDEEYLDCMTDPEAPSTASRFAPNPMSTLENE